MQWARELETLSHFDFLFGLASFCTVSADAGTDTPATAAADMAAAKHTNVNQKYKIAWR